MVQLSYGFIKGKMLPMNVARPMFPVLFCLRSFDFDFVELLNYYIDPISLHYIWKKISVG